MIGILVVLIFLFIYDWYKTNEPYQSEPLQKTNFIINNTNQKYLDTTLMVALNAATIHGKTIMIEDMTPELVAKFRDNGGVHLSAAVIGDPEGKQFILFVDKFTHRSAIRVISHEVVHIMQYSSGRLKVIPNLGIIWEKDTISFDLLYNINYRDRPWEMEAFDNESELASRVEKLLY